MSAALAIRFHGGELRIPIRGGATKTVKTNLTVPVMRLAPANAEASVHLAR